MGLRDWLDTVFDNPDQTSADGGDGELSEGGDGGDGVTQDSHNTDSETISHASNPDSGMEVGRVSSEKHRNEMNSEGGFVFGESPIGPERKKEGPNTDDPDASPPEQEDVEAIDSETNSSSNQHPDATGEPTRAQLIEELQRLRREYGPTVIKSKYMNSRGEYSVNQYVEEFGSWEEALAAADIDKRAILLEDLATVWESIGRTPKTTDIDKYGDFSSGLYTVFFGSWSEAKDQCRQEHSVTSETSREETTTNSVSSDATTKHSRNTTSSRRSKLIQEIQRVEEQLGDRVVNSKNFRNESGYAFKEIIDEFGSWSDALDAAGIDRSEVILEEIARIWRDLGEQPTTTQMNEFSRLGSGLYSSEFESWSDAIEKCRSTHDVPDERPQTSSESEEQTASTDLSDTGSDAPSRSELIAELQRINDKLDHLVKAPELPQHSEFSQADYETEFGSWDDALAAAGIDKKAVLLDELQRIWMKLGRRPKTSDMNNHGDYSAGMYSRAFGSWGEAISTVKERRQFDHDSKDSGEEPNSDRNHSDSSARSNGPDRSELVDELNRLHDQIGHKVINSRHLQQESDFTISDFTDEFGSWNAAFDAAGIDREAVFLDELARVWRKLGREPTTAEMREHGDIGAGLYSQEFRSWGDAKEQCRKEYEISTEEASNQNGSSSQTQKGDGETDRDVLSASLRDHLATITDITDSGRVDKPIIVRIESAPESQQKRQSRDIRVKGVTGETFSLVIWREHNIEVDWREAHWYLLQEPRMNVWEVEGTKHSQLSSTHELKVTDLGTSISDEQIRSLLTRDESESDDETTKADIETSDAPDESESSDLVGSLMDDMDL